MPLKFPLGVRFITHSMNSAALIYSFRSVPVISKALLPSRLTCLGLCSRVSFSTRPDFGRRSRVEGGEIRASKSLIEDEAELSDWVSDLRTSSARGKYTSDEDDSAVVRRKVVEMDDGRGPGPRRGREGQSDRFGGSRRGKEGEVDRFGGSNRRRTGGEPVRNKRFGDGEGGRNGRVQGRSSGESSSFRGRNERNVDSGFRRERGLEANKGGLGKQTRGLRREEKDSSDEDEKRVVLGGIDDLLSEDSSEEDDSGDDEAFVGNVVSDNPSTETAKTSDSYLSKTRFVCICYVVSL